MQENLTLLSGGALSPRCEKVFTNKVKFSDKVMEQFKYTLFGSVFSVTVDSVLIRGVVEWN